MLYNNDIICFSHLRWNFVYQRPQHLLSRFSKEQRIFFIEEPIFDTTFDYNYIEEKDTNIWIVVPHLTPSSSTEEVNQKQKNQLHSLIYTKSIDHYILWYYSPMALSYGEYLSPKIIVYDCMDELSAFKFASPKLKYYEDKLLQKADIVFTGGHSLFEAKKHKHHHIFSFPSSIDKQHFIAARNKKEEPQDQKSIPYPRLGFYGVLDERIDLELIDKMAVMRPEWQFIFIGPIVKIDPDSLPKRNNIYYLGMKDYQDLPSYLAHWDIALMPFALNESTKFISPTKTPEYLAGGKPVISTAIQDVVNSYAHIDLVHIAHSPAEFIKAAENILANQHAYTVWLQKVDAFLADMSWDKTWQKMNTLIQELIQKNINITLQTPQAYV